jgi:membrane fusion protein (multidrug efflux system)
MATITQEMPTIEDLQPLAESKTTSNGRTNPKWLMIGAGAALVLLITVGAMYLHFRGRVTTDDAQVDAHIAPIAPKVFGNVAEILVEDNQMVKAGQVLLRIDARDYEAKVAQARGALAAAENQSAGAQVGVPLVNATTASNTAGAEAQLAAAEADHNRAKADYDRASSSELAYARADINAKRAIADRAMADRTRMEPLAKQDEITELQFDAYIAAAKVAESDLHAAEEKLTNAEKQSQSSKSAMEAAAARVSAARAVVDQAKANRQQVAISSSQAGTASAAVMQAKANLEAAELQLSYTTMVAPVDGVVTKKNVQLGQIVQPGQSLLAVVPVREAYITANFKETQLADVRPGQRARVKIDMYGRSFEGRVESVSNATGARLSLLPPENATGNYVKIVQRIPVKLAVDKLPDGFVLRPGMNVEATIFTK